MTARLLGRAAARCSGHTAPAHRPLHRGFSTSSALLAKRAPRPSPRVRDLDFRRKQEKSRTEQQQTQHAPAEPDGTHRPWPIPALAAAFVSGMMAVSATKAVRILDDFTAPSQSSKLTRAEAQRLCDDHGITAATLTILGLVLSRSDAKFKPITYNLYLAASKLEYGPAAMVLLSMAIDGKYSNRPELEPALVQLDQMVKQDNGPAIYLKGRLFEAQGEPEMALVMYEKAASILPNGYAAGDTMDETPAQAYASIVCLKAQNNDWPGLMAALEKAALQHDDPASIFAYAENSRSRDHPEWLFYMTKSAISGDYRATWRLGIYHARRFVKALSQPEEASRMAVWTKGMLMRLGLGSLFPRRAVDDSRDLALEWLSMAAMTVDRDRQTVGDSEVIAEISAMIDEGHFYLGLLLREKGDTVRGLQMLDLAAASPQLAEYAVPFFRHHWHNQDMALKNLDVDGIITGQMVI